MKRSRLSVPWPLLSLLALVLGFGAVVLVNVVGGIGFDSVLPGSLGADGMPVTPTGQALYLPVLFLAGMAGACVVVLVAPRKPLVHVLVFGTLAVLFDIRVALDHGAVWPLWFSVLVVLTVPPQIWAGAVLGLRLRRRWFRPAPAPAEAARGALMPR